MWTAEGPEKSLRKWPYDDDHVLNKNSHLNKQQEALIERSFRSILSYSLGCCCCRFFFFLNSLRLYVNTREKGQAIY